MKIIPSKYVQPLFTQKFYEADVWGGRGRGGSHNLTLYAFYLMITSNYFRGYFVRAIQGSIRDSLWRDFKDRIEEVSEINKTDYFKLFQLNENDMTAVYKPNGNIIRSKGFKASSKSNTANMKSIAGATHIFGEEWEEVGQEENNKLMDSLRTVKKNVDIQIIRSWNSPPKDHWLVNEYFDLIKSKYSGYYKLKPKGINGHLSLFGTYKDNIKNLNSNTLARYKRYKQTMPKYYYNQILGLVPDGGDSKVYYNWQRVSDAMYKSIPGVKAYGVDFGDTAPTTLYEVKYYDGCFYRKEMLYKSMRELSYEHKIEAKRNEITEYSPNNIWTKHKGLLTYVFELMKVDKNQMMFCDPAQKGLIIELREAGYNAVRAKKDKASNINFINRAVNYYTDTSYNLEAEYNSYYLETDINKNPIDGKPKGGNDHGLDACEYACRGLKDEYDIRL